MEEHQFEVKYLSEKIPAFYVKNPDTAKAILKKLMTYDVLFGLDTETGALPKYKNYPKAALNPLLSTIRLLQIYNGKSSIIFDMMYLPKLKLFKDFLASKKFVAHYAIFDLQFLEHDFGVQNINCGCTHLIWKLITHATRPTDEGIKASLEVLADKLLHFPMLKTVQASDWSVPELTFEQIEYAALDAVTVRKLADVIAPALVNLKLDKYYQLCKAAQAPLVQMQLNGIGFNKPDHLQQIAKWRGELYEAKKQLTEITGLEKITDHTIANYLEEHLPSNVLLLWPRNEPTKPDNLGKLKVDSHTFSDFEDVSPVVKPFIRKKKSCVQLLEVS
jgi:ribonuclease D